MTSLWRNFTFFLYQLQLFKNFCFQSLLNRLLPSGVIFSKPGVRRVFINNAGTRSQSCTNGWEVCGHITRRCSELSEASYLQKWRYFTFCISPSAENRMHRASLVSGVPKGGLKRLDPIGRWKKFKLSCICMCIQYMWCLMVNVVKYLNIQVFKYYLNTVTGIWKWCLNTPWNLDVLIVFSICQLTRYNFNINYLTLH